MFVGYSLYSIGVCDKQRREMAKGRTRFSNHGDYPLSSDSDSSVEGTFVAAAFDEQTNGKQRGKMRTTIRCGEMLAVSDM